MDYRLFLALSLGFLCILPDLSVSSIRLGKPVEDKSTRGSVLKLNKEGSSLAVDPTRVTQLSWHPSVSQVLGATSMATTTGKYPGQLKEDVTSPSGTTITGIHELKKGGFYGTL